MTQLMNCGILGIERKEMKTKRADKEDGFCAYVEKILGVEDKGVSDLKIRSKEIKAEIRAIKKEMAGASVRVISCFNGGLTTEEGRYNSRLFQLKTELLKAKELEGPKQ